MRQDLVLIGLLLAGPALPAAAQDDAAKQELDDLKRSQAELRRLVEEQQKRIEELERRQAPAAPAPSPALPPPAAGPTPAGTVEDRLKKLEDQSVKRGDDRPETLRAYWKEGFFLETADKAFKIQIAGWAFADAVWIRADDDLEKAPTAPGVAAPVGDQEDYFDFRTARLWLTGTLYERIEFKAQYEFAESTPNQAQVKDLYIGVNRIPVIGNVRVGQFKEPFSLDQLTSLRSVMFMERALTDAFAPSRHTGAMIFNAPLEERMTWAAGVFRNTDSWGRETSEGEYDLTGRLTGLPWNAEEGRQLWHLGAGYSHRSPTDDAVRIRQRPETHDASRFTDTGTMTNVESADLLGLESAVVWGPVSVQGEWVSEFLHRNRKAPDDSNEFEGWYGQASWFVTGESRAYKKSAGAFDRVRPKANFLDGKGGTGAFELAVRYSRLDLIDGAVDGRRMGDLTAGVNWYLNPMTRIMLNYIHSEVENRGNDVGDADIFSMRFQVDF